MTRRDGSRTSKLPRKFSLGMALVVIGRSDRTVDGAQFVRAKAHYDDLISQASFTVRNFAADMRMIRAGTSGKAARRRR